MRRLTDAYSRLLDVPLGISVAALMLPVTIQIVARYTALIPAWIWTEEMARFLFIWMVMLGSMIGVREGTHFEVDVWPQLSDRGNALLRIVTYAFILVFAHRHFAVTGPQGEFRIDGVPPGAYTVSVWHPTFTAKSESVRIPEQGGEVEASFVLS